MALKLVQMPTILADNGGHDSADLVSKLRAAHYEGQSDAGLGKGINLSRSPTRSHADSLACDFDRYGSWSGSVHAKARYHGKLQAQATGRSQCK
jgi:hypothetical protein